MEQQRFPARREEEKEDDAAAGTAKEVEEEEGRSSRRPVGTSLLHHSLLVVLPSMGQTRENKQRCRADNVTFLLFSALLFSDSIAD